MKTTTIFTFLSRLSMDDHKVLYHVYWDHKTDEYKHDCISNDNFIELMDNLCVDTFANCIRVLKGHRSGISFSSSLILRCI